MAPAPRGRAGGRPVRHGHGASRKILFAQALPATIGLAEWFLA
jgi:hypothetical protein